MKELKGLRIRQRFVEHLGCFKGCTEFLGREIPFPWLYGGTGHAFIITLDPGVDVSSPFAWDAQVMLDLAPNLGFKVDGFAVWKEKAGDAFPEKQREAWDFVRANIDRGVPCYGWELKAPYGGYWVIYGYDDVGYYYSGWETGGPTPWPKLGELFIPLLEVRCVELCDPASDGKVVADGLMMALKHAENPPEWLGRYARSGQAAWAYWAEALETGEAKRDHHTYNAQVWLECREMAVEFLKEAKERLPGRCDAAFDEAAEHYATVCEKFEALIELHPEREKPDWGPQSTFSSPEAAVIVREAAEADRKGLGYLRQIVNAL